MISVAVIGARGFAGGELLRLIEGHPMFSLAYAASRKVGEAVPFHSELEFVESNPSTVGPADLVFLAMPDGASEPYVEALQDSVIVDLSSDHRFDSDWFYGLPSVGKCPPKGAKRVSNPGCYATAIQIGLSPLMEHLAETPFAFGVSGYSGAGTTPSPRNDVSLLEGGVVPYKLVGHTHEREVSKHLGRKVRFSPHVAPFFRGLTVTIGAETKEPLEDLAGLYQRTYGETALVEVLGAEPPRVQDISGKLGAQVGGFSADGTSVALVCVLDNLLLGAASQAVQNANLALGLPELTGLEEGNA